jgi:hypothetical protein
MSWITLSHVGSPLELLTDLFFTSVEITNWFPLSTHERYIREQDLTENRVGMSGVSYRPITRFQYAQERASKILLEQHPEPVLNHRQLIAFLRLAYLRAFHE